MIGDGMADHGVRKPGIGGVAFYKWRAKFVGMDATVVAIAT